MPMNKDVEFGKVPQPFSTTKDKSGGESVISMLSEHGTTGELGSRKNSPNTTFKKKGG